MESPLAQNLSSYAAFQKAEELLMQLEFGGGSRAQVDQQRRVVEAARQQYEADRAAVDAHNLSSYGVYQTADSAFMQLQFGGGSRSQVDQQRRTVEAARQTYEADRLVMDRMVAARAAEEAEAAAMATRVEAAREVDRVRLERMAEAAQGAPVSESIPVCSIDQRPERTLGQIAPLVAAAAPDEIFVFDFDDTLTTRYGTLWAYGYLRHDATKQPDSYLPMPGFEEVLGALSAPGGQGNFFILTARNPIGVADVQQHLGQYGLPVFAAGTKREDDTAVTKGEYLRSMIESNPSYRVWNFVDDGEDNITSVREIISQNCPRSVTVNLFHTLGLEEFGQRVSPADQDRLRNEYFDILESA